MSALHFEITGGNDSFKKSIEESRAIAKHFIDEVEKGGKGIDELFKKGAEGQRLSAQMTKEAIAMEKIKQETSKTSIQQTKAQIEAVKLELEQAKLLKQQSSTDKIVHTTREIINITNEATQVFVKYAGSLEELDRRVKELTKEYLSMNAAQKASSQGQGVINEISILNSQRKIEADSLRALQKEYVNTQRMQDLQEGSITALRAQLSQLTATYDNMGRSMRNSASGKELIGNIQLVTTELNEAEQASMRFNRNVGNYASGWNGLSMQVQQVARELPAMAMGANTFFLAISNNLPMLADEIKRAKTEYKSLTAEGKNATPVWKQVISSLFSWQTALVAGVTILSIYGKEIISWVGSLFTAKKALSETYQSLEDFQKKVGESSGSVIATLEKLSEGWKRLGGDIDAQKKYILDNKDAINGMGVSVTDAAEAERLFNTNKDTFILGILERAKAAATMELAAEEYKKAVQKMMEADAMPDKKTHKYSNATNVIDLFKSSTWQTVEYDNPDKVTAKKQADDFIKSGTELVQKYVQFSEEERKTLESIGIKTTKTIVDGSIESIEAAIAIKQQSLKKVTDPKDYKRIEDEIKAEQAKLKAITGEKEKVNLNNYVDSYGQSKEIQKSAQTIKDAITQSELSIQQQQVDLMDEGSNKQLAQIRLNYEKRFSEILKGEREALQLLQDEERKQWEKKNPDFKKKNLQFTPTITALPQNDKNRFDTEYSLAFQKQDSDIKAFFDKMIGKYQDFAAQRESVEKQYNDDIAALQSQRTDANAEEVDRAIKVAQDKMKEATQKINDEEATTAQKDSPFLKRLFGDYSQMKFDDLQKLIEEAKQLQAHLSGNGDAEGLTFITKEQLSLIAKSPAELDKLQKGLDKLLKGGKSNSWDNIFENFNKGLAKLKSSKNMKDVSAGMQDIGEAASEASSVVAGVAGSLSSMFEAMGNTEAADAMSSIQDAMNAISNIGQGFAKGGLIGGIAAAVGEAANFIGKAFAANARHKEALKVIMDEATAQQRAYNLLLLEQNLLYEKGVTVFGTDAYGKAKNAVDNMKESLASLNKELAGTDEQKKGQKSDSIFKKLFGVQDANAALKQAYAGLADVEIKTGHKKTGLFGWGSGKDIYSSILSVYPQLVDANGKFDKELAGTIINTREMSDESKNALQNMINLAQQAEEAYEALNDYMTDIFGDLGGSMSDALVDAFRNGTDAAQSFTDSVSNMLETLAKQMIYSVTLAPIIEKAQKQMMDVMQNVGLSDEQKFNQWAGILDGLVDGAIEQQGYANSLYEKFKQSAADKGFDIFSPDKETSQSSTKGGFATASQDSISELNGRFTAGQIAWEETKNAMLAVQVSVSGISSLVSEKNTILMEIRNLAIMSNVHLEDIAGFQKRIVKEFGSRLESIDRGVQKFSSR